MCATEAVVEVVVSPPPSDDPDDDDDPEVQLYKSFRLVPGRLRRRITGGESREVVMLLMIVGGWKFGCIVGVVGEKFGCLGSFFLFQRFFGFCF